MFFFFNKYVITLINNFIKCDLAPFRYVRWIRDDTLLVDSRNVEIAPRITLFSNGSLLVNQLRPEDTGEYICEVMTYAGLMDSQVHAIEVQRK